MKEISLLTEWADNVISEKTQSSRMGTPMKAIGDRPLPRQIDIQYKASRAHPELSPEQALALYMSDELVDKEKMDLAQNKLINRARSENDKLRKNLDDLNKELHDHEAQAARTDQEVERLKDLSSKLKPAGELQQQVAKASADKVQQMLTQLDTIKTKPGMDPEKVKEIEAKIEQIKNSPADNTDIEQVNHTLEILSKKQEIDDSLFQQVMGKLEHTENQLQKKEQRFQKSIRRNAEKIGSWGNKFNELDKKFNEIENRADAKLKEIETIAQDADETVDQLARMMRMVNPNQSIQPASHALDVIDDREEVQAAMGNPGASSLPAHEPEEDDAEVAVAEPEQEDDYSLDDISDLLNKYRKPTNVKKGGQMNEQIEMHEPEDEVETVIIPKLVRRYRIMFPLDLKNYSEEQLKEILRRTVDRRLLIWAPDIDETRIKNYLEACHHWLRKTRPANPELPGMPTEVPNGIKESLFKDFTKGLDKLTGGY